MGVGTDTDTEIRATGMEIRATGIRMELSQHFAELKEKQPAVEISNWDKLDPAVRRQVALERVEAVLSRILGDGETSLEVPMRPSLQDVKFEDSTIFLKRE